MPSLKSVKKPFSCAKPNVKNDAGVRARLVVLAQEDHRGPAALIHAPRAADREVIEEFDVERGEREVAAEPAVDARPEPEVLKQLGGLEVRAEEPLFRVDGHASLEPDALRFGAAVYQKKDSDRGSDRRETVL